MSGVLDKLSEIEKELEDLKEKLLQYKAEKDGTQKNYKPEKEDRYYSIDWGFLEVDGSTPHIWNDDYIDKGRLSIGNVFRTEDDARKVIEKLQAFQRLRQRGFHFRQVSPADSVLQDRRSQMIYITAFMDATTADTMDDNATLIMKDLELLFGGE